MKILSLHCDYITFKPLKKALKEPEELSEERKKEKTVKEVLVILTAVEEGDNNNITEKYITEIINIAEQVKTKNIVLYPYAHLSSNLGKPQVAMEIMASAQQLLEKKNYKVDRAPFGYYKEFSLKVKGHPLSELSRSISVGGEKEKKNSEKKATLGGSYDYKQLLREISKSRLDTSKLKDNDHRILGQKLDLFSFSEVAPGMVFWHNNGVLVRNKLIEYWRKKHTLAGYTEVQTPQIMDSKLWKVSGHWDKYKDNNFVTDYEGRNFLVKPMNCPGGIIIYRNSPKSYKDLPLRVGELGLVHRTELSGVLAGLLRVIQFTQDDAHLYCADEKQASEEIKNVVKLLEEFYNEFGLPIDHVELSTRPEKRIGSDKMWDTAEKILEDVLKKTKLKYKINKGDGAFYGPKIDFHVKDSLGRTWQLGTIQLDFSLPERFDLTYIGKDNNPKRPIMIHRVIYGSLERFIAVLLEHTNGQLPAWLSPIQARILSFTERNKEYSEKVLEEIKKEIPGIRIDTDFRDVPLNNKVREAELQKIPFIIVLGDKEEKERNIALRERGEKKIKMITNEEIIKMLKKETAMP